VMNICTRLAINVVVHSKDAKTQRFAAIAGVATLGVGALTFCVIAYDQGVGASLDVMMSRHYNVEMGKLPAEVREEVAEDLEAKYADMKHTDAVVLEGTSPPKYWTSPQAGPAPDKDFEAVRLKPGSLEWKALEACLDGNDIGAGGKDSISGKPYNKLELAAVWRVENQTLWAKYAAEKMQTSTTMKALPSSVKVKTANPRINQTLIKASRPLRKKGGCDPLVNEYYLFHGLGFPDGTLLNICSSGHNEHFSGANAGTMFGDGVYLAEDMGKSDQYCRTLDAKVATAFKTLAGPKRDAAAVKTEGWKATKDPKSGDTYWHNAKKETTWDDPSYTAAQKKAAKPLTKEHMALHAALFSDLGPKDTLVDWQFAFVSRSVVGAFLQQGHNGHGTAAAKQLNSSANTFAAGTRELAIIPGHTPPTHYHSEIAEITRSGFSGNKFRDTYYAGGGAMALRFREIIIFKPTLLFPEYLIAYKHASH